MKRFVTHPIDRLMIGFALLWGPSAAASPDPANGPPFKPTASVRVLMTDGDTLEALGAESAPFDMVRVTMADGRYRYIAPVRIRTVLDESGADRTRPLLNDREQVGTPLPPALSPPGRGLRVGPRSVTRHFSITETTVLGRISSESSSQPASLGFDMGSMSNVTERAALGGSVFLATGGQFDANIGFRMRYRRWLTRTASVDVAPGIAWGRNMSSTAVPPAYSVQVSLSPSRYVSLVADVSTARQYRYGYDGLRLERQKHREVGVMAGIRIGQWPGAVAGILPILTTLFASTATVVH